MGWCDHKDCDEYEEEAFHLFLIMHVRSVLQVSIVSSNSRIDHMNDEDDDELTNGVNDQR